MLYSHFCLQFSVFSSTMFLRILLILVVLLYSSGYSLQSTPFEKVKVQITNDMDPSTELDLHCKSKDDDLGIHTLQKGQSYSFKFRVNLFQRTLFFCNFRWKLKGGVLNNWLNIYEATGPKGECSDCNWKVYTDSACLNTTVTKSAVQCFPYYPKYNLPAV